jgi:hypothetical protein
MMLQQTQDRLYLYAIVTGSQALEAALVGLGDAPVTLLPYQGIAAAVSAVEVDRVRPEAEQLLRHEQVIEALMAQRSTLPVRFGTVLSSTAKVLETLAERYDNLLANLVRLAGQVEVGLRVLWDAEAVKTHVETFEVSPAPWPGATGPLWVVQPGAEGPLEPKAPCGWAAVATLAWPPGQAGRRQDRLAARPGETSKIFDRPGTRYLLARAQEAAAERFLTGRAQALEIWCRQRLGPLASDMTTRVLATDGLPVSAAFLVLRDRVPALLAEAGQMQRESPELEFICTGPWPPYHFVKQGA